DHARCGRAFAAVRRILVGVDEVVRHHAHARVAALRARAVRGAAAGVAAADCGAETRAADLTPAAHAVLARALVERRAAGAAVAVLIAVAQPAARHGVARALDDLASGPALHAAAADGVLNGRAPLRLAVGGAAAAVLVAVVGARVLRVDER